MVYTWGEGLYGQLGHGIEVDHLFEPTILSKLVGKEIINVFKNIDINFKEVYLIDNRVSKEDAYKYSFGSKKKIKVNK